MPSVFEPDLTYLQALVSAVETHYHEQDDEIDLRRRVRSLNDPPHIPDDLKVGDIDTTIQDPIVTDECARVVASLAKNSPKCQVTAGDQATDAGQENSTLREHFTEEVFRSCGSRVPGMETFRALVDACVADGGAVAKLLYLPDTWESVFKLREEDYEDDGDDVPRERRRSRNQKFNGSRENQKKKSGAPFVWLPVDIRTWYPVFESDKIVECIEVTERSTLDIRRQYGIAIGKDGRLEERIGPPMSRDEGQVFPSTVRFIEYWNERWAAAYVENGRGESRLLRTWRHDYGRVPYFFMPGLMMNHWRGRKCGWGVADSKIDLARFRSFMLTLMLQSTARQAGAPMKWTKPQGAEPVVGTDRAPIPVLDVPLAGLLNLGPEEDVKVVDLPGIPESIEKMVAVATRMLDDLNTPRMGANLGGDLAGAGYAINSVLAEAKSKHDPFLKSIARGYEEATYFMWELICNRVKEKVWVRTSPVAGQPNSPTMQWLGAGPDDLDEAVGVIWVIDPEPATSKIVDERYVGERLQQGTMSLDQAIAYLGDNPDEVRLGKVLDRLRNEPFYTQYVNEQVMRKLRRGDLLKQAADAMAQTGLVPGMPPQLAAQMLMQRMGTGAPMGLPPGAAPGGPIMPDQGALAMSPGGTGAAMAPSPYPGGLPPGAVPGAPLGMGPVLPMQTMQAGVQSLGSGVQ